MDTLQLQISSLSCFLSALAARYKEEAKRSKLSDNKNDDFILVGSNQAEDGTSRCFRLLAYSPAKLATQIVVVLVRDGASIQAGLHDIRPLG